MIPDKCPKCGAGIPPAGEDGYCGNRSHFLCGKSIAVENHITLDCLMNQAEQRDEQLDQLAAELKQIRDALKDPGAVWINMCRGQIARPSALDHYEECKAVVGKMEAENAALRERVKRLEEAGDGLLEIVEAEAWDAHLANEITPRAERWTKAKEAKQ